MKRSLLAALLIAAGAVAAPAQRISLLAPLSPVPGSGVAGAAPLSQLEYPIALSLYTPGLSAASIQPPFGAVPLETPRPLFLRASVPSLVPAALTPRQIESVKPGMHSTAKVIDALRAHGIESAGISKLAGENGKNALEFNFMSAASLGDETPVPPSGSGDASNLPPQDNNRPLLDRLLERVTLDDRGREDEKQALMDAFKHLLATPTGARYAEEFLAEGLTANVHFDDFPDSQLYLVNNRKKFYAAQAYTDWKPDENRPVVRLNRHYIDGDPDYLRESLPAVLGHELLGHGLLYGRAAKEDLYLATFYHDLNETSARLIGWAIDHELDGKFEDAGAWNFSQDPANYLTRLKLKLPYYAVTFNAGEMADPIGTLRARLGVAREGIARAQRNVDSQKTWLPVLDHFIEDHGIPASRFELLRKELADLEAHYAAEVANAEAIVKEVSAFIGRLEAEPGRGSENYLKKASANPFFKRLVEENERLTALVRGMASGGFVPPRPPAPRPADQISWDEFEKMYRDDMAADAHRSKKHWSR
ncbi:MAG: hypothetical protein HY923_05515 [Elusimicrobia bacterium]|nr:hypothetical protein [Elusimicrobiota bacterium]